MMFRILATTLLLSFSALAAADNLAAAESPLPMLQQVQQRMFDALESRAEWYREEPQRFHALVEETLVPHVDFPRFAQMVAPTQWRGASNEQRLRYVEAFRIFLIRLYSNALLRAEVLDNISHETITFQSLRMEAGAERTVVRARVARAGGSPVSVQFDVYRRDGEWKVWNLRVEDLNMVLSYRQQFQRSALDEISDWLEERNQRLLEEGGTVEIEGLPH